MFAATKGVNTHKGTIFSLRILIGAVGVLKQGNQMINRANLQRVVRQMLADLLATDLDGLKKDTKLTAGEQQYLAYGHTGIRGEAASGFPTIFEYGLPTLVNRQGATQNDRQLEALLVMARHTGNSTLIKRAGDPAILKWKDQQLYHLFDLGELGTSEGRQFLTALETTFSASHLSLGGAADLLIATIFLAKVMEGADNDELND